MDPFFVLLHNSGWMLWNLILAWLPVGLAWYLFCKRSDWFVSVWRTGISIVLFLVFIAFYPNSIYLLTDWIHYPLQHIYLSQISEFADLVLFVQYAFLTLNGLVTHIVVLMLFFRWVEKLHVRLSHKIIIDILFVSFVTIAFPYGLWLGRVLRLNSWDLITFSGWQQIFDGTLYAMQYSEFWLLILGWAVLILCVNLVAVVMWYALSHLNLNTLSHGRGKVC